MKIVKFMAGAIVLAVAGPGLLAAQQTTPSATSAAAVSGVGGSVVYRELDDMDVVGRNGERVGDVEEVLLDVTGGTVAVAVEVGGFLGLGERDVVLRLDQLRFENNRLVTDMTKEQIENLPEWDD